MTGEEEGTVEERGETAQLPTIRLIQAMSGTQMGYPDDYSTTAYLFPWYNNFDVDTQLRTAVP